MKVCEKNASSVSFWKITLSPIYKNANQCFTKIFMINWILGSAREICIDLPIDDINAHKISNTSVALNERYQFSSKFQGKNLLIVYFQKHCNIWTTPPVNPLGLRDGEEFDGARTLLA